MVSIIMTMSTKDFSWSNLSFNKMTSTTYSSSVEDVGTAAVFSKLMKE